MALEIVITTFLFVLLAMAAFVFWVWMLVDIFKRQDGAKLVGWLLVVLLFGVIGAIIYYLVGREHPRKLSAPAATRPRPVKRVKLQAPKAPKKTTKKKVAKKATKKKTTKKKTTRKRS